MRVATQAIHIVWNVGVYRVPLESRVTLDLKETQDLMVCLENLVSLEVLGLMVALG